MNIVTLNTEENEEHRLKNTQEDESATRSHNAFFQELDLQENKKDDDEIPTEANQRDITFSAPREHSRHLKPEYFMMPSSTNRVEHRRNNSLLERMRDSLFGRQDSRANEQSELSSSREYQKIPCERDQISENQIEIVTTRRDSDTGRFRSQSNRSMDEKQTKNFTRSSYFKPTLEKEHSIQSSRGSKLSTAKPLFKRSNAVIDTQQYWKKIRAVRHVFKFTSK